TSTGDATALDISWSAVAGATGYKVYRATSSISDGASVTLVDGSATTTTSFTDDCSGDGTANIPSVNTTGGSLKLVGGPSLPTSPTEGELFFSTSTKQLYIYANSKWQADRTVATKIVSASNSQNKEKADYVCDGTSDEQEIEQAINDLPSTGGIVYLLEGTYYISSSIDITKSNVSLIGSGWSTKLYLIDGANTDVIVLGDGSNSYEGITIANLQIDGNDANQTEGGLQCIEFKNNVTQSKVEGCYIHNGDLAGIKIGDIAFYNKILNNYIYDNGSGGSGAGGIDLNGSYNIIQGNKFSSNLMSSIVPDGDYNIISNNEFKSAKKVLWPDGSPGTNYVFSNNVIDSPSSDGLELNASKSIIIGNTFRSTGGHGIYFLGSDSVISDNVIYEVGTGDDGIYLAGDNNIVSSNRIYDSSGSRYGINLASGADNNQVLGNEITGAGFTEKVHDDGSGNTIQQRDWFEVEANSSITALTVTQSGTGDIVNLYDGSYKVFQVADGGNITAWRNATLTGGNLTIGPLSPPTGLSVATSSSSGSCATGTTYYY
ncbi:right-handed parallel beta-helix repeat-containing protein, partial [bacterium]|nr:right-handed parallel beta-helix repeat-containing protein [bacterium]